MTRRALQRAAVASAPEPVDLAALARRANQGDVRARDELLRALYVPVRKHVGFVVGGGQLAEDIVQDTMIALYRGLASFRGEAHPRTWALTIATRVARKATKKNARWVPTDDLDTAVFDTDASAAAELVMLQRALARIAPKKREAFVLMSLLELTAEEAGAALGTFANTAASRNRHARAELEALLDQEAT